MKRSLLLACLLAVYAAPLGERWWSGREGANAFDALQPRSREVERAIAAGRFADALPMAAGLEKTYPREALVAYWLAGIYRGLDRPGDEVAAWERYVALSSAPEEAREDACPAIAEARERLGDRAGALREYQHCAELDPADPDVAQGLRRLVPPPSGGS